MPGPTKKLPRFDAGGGLPRIPPPPPGPGPTDDDYTGLTRDIDAGRPPSVAALARMEQAMAKAQAELRRLRGYAAGGKVPPAKPSATRPTAPARPAPKPAPRPTSARGGGSTGGKRGR